MPPLLQGLPIDAPRTCRTVVTPNWARDVRRIRRTNPARGRRGKRVQMFHATLLGTHEKVDVSAAPGR